MATNPRSGRATACVLSALLLGGYAAVAHSAGPGSAGLVGNWRGRNGQVDYWLNLEANGQGLLNGTAVLWKFDSGSLRLMAERGSYQYAASFTENTLALSGNDLQQPLIFQRVGVSTSSPPGVGSAPKARRLPIPGNPPLTQEMVDKGSRLFEWLLDARLTEEQAQQFEDSLVRSWKTQNAAEISGTLNVLKLYDDLGSRRPVERNAIRETLLNQFLESMRATPKDPLAKWVLAIYYSAHTPIAQGNPPLTRQVADAYTEVNCFMMSEVLGGAAFKPDQAFKDALASTLVAGYSSFAPARQKEYARLPMAWAAIRLTWPTLSEAQRAGYRQQWAPGVHAMLAPAPTPAHQPPPRPASTDSRTALQNFRSHLRTRQWLFNMNQDYIHKHVLSPGWTYSKYQLW